uniref:Uncharacterized protein n=1 Tax=Anguilla anguilla TaxID=7936 RepID=A0A0E9Q0I4_ANGAN
MILEKILSGRMTPVQLQAMLKGTGGSNDSGSHLGPTSAVLLNVMWLPLLKKLK